MQTKKCHQRSRVQYKAPRATEILIYLFGTINDNRIRYKALSSPAAAANIPLPSIVPVLYGR